MIPCRWWLLLLLLFALLGCNHHQLRPETTGQSSLDHWVETELTPYLSRQLSRHPLFRDEPLLLVKMKGEDIQPEIDDLTLAMRSHLRMTLLSTRGVNLAWEPSRSGDLHHRQPARIDCHDRRPARLFIGIEHAPLPDGRYRVSVRALDTGARTWISGFGRSWTGRLTSSEEQALARSRVDELLRGLRVLPFDDHQIDLAADYLANNLECLLRQQEQDQPVLHVERKQLRSTLMTRLLGMIGSHLSRYGEVRVSDRKREAGFILSGESHALGDGLHQVWIRIQPQHSSVRLAGMDTATYIRTSDRRRTLAVDSAPEITTLALTPSAPEAKFCPAGEGESCYRLDISSKGADRVFIIAHLPHSGVVRLHPGRCRLVSSAADSGRHRRQLQALALPDLRQGQSSLYVIAARGEPAQRALVSHLEQISDYCDERHRLTGEGLSDIWLDGLDRLLVRYQRQLAWSVVRTPG